MELWSLQADALSRARLVTLLVLLVATAAIALANSSPDPVTFDNVIEFGYRKESMEWVYGPKRT